MRKTVIPTTAERCGKANMRDYAAEVENLDKWMGEYLKTISVPAETSLESRMIGTWER